MAGAFALLMALLAGCGGASATDRFCGAASKIDAAGELPAGQGFRVVSGQLPVLAANAPPEAREAAATLARDFKAVREGKTYKDRTQATSLLSSTPARQSYDTVSSVVRSECGFRLDGNAG